MAGVAALVIAADQATTSWALADLHRARHVWGPFGLALQFNSGSAFSILSGSGSGWLVGTLAVVALAAVGALAWRADTTGAAVAFGLVLGGAVGNLADRLVRGHHGAVVDFITLTHWPTFNVADACITVGVVVLAVAYLWAPHRASSRSNATDPPGASASAAGATRRPDNQGTDGAGGSDHHYGAGTLTSNTTWVRWPGGRPR